MTITDEMVEKANDAWCGDSHEHVRYHTAMRKALEAVAPLLIAQGLREAADICDNLEKGGCDAQVAIALRAQEIDPK